MKEKVNQLKKKLIKFIKLRNILVFRRIYNEKKMRDKMKLKFKLIKLNVPKEKKEIHKKPKYFIRKW